MALSCARVAQNSAAMRPRPRLRSDGSEERRSPGVEPAVKSFARKFDPELTRFDVATQTVRLVGIIQTAVSRTEQKRRAGLTNIELAEMFYAEVVAVLVEMRGVMRLPVNRLGRAQCVRKCHCAQPGLSHESGIVVLLSRPCNRLAGRFHRWLRAKPRGVERRANVLVSKTTRIASSLRAVPSRRTAVWRFRSPTPPSPRIVTA